MAHTPYKFRPEWADVSPASLTEGDDAVIRIAYNNKFQDVMSYFLAVLASGESSPRVLGLTQDAISLNPSNYSAWQVRRSCLTTAIISSTSGGVGAREQGRREAVIAKELEFIASVSADSSKNYQLWHHRRWLVDALQDGRPEMLFTMGHIGEDAKHYHAWAHRQWAIARWGLWDDECCGVAGGELGFTEALIHDDVRNNSAWNHRWVVLTQGKRPCLLNDALVSRELAFALGHISRVTLNESAWRFARAVVACCEVSRARTDTGAWADLIAAARAVQEAAAPGCNPFAAELLAEAYEHAASNGDAHHVDSRARAVEMYTECSQVDRVRKQYWTARAVGVQIKIEGSAVHAGPEWVAQRQ